MQSEDGIVTFQIMSLENIVGFHYDFEEQHWYFHGFE